MSRKMTDLHRATHEEGVISSMVANNLRMPETDYLKIMKRHKPYQNDIYQIKKELENEKKSGK